MRFADQITDHGFIHPSLTDLPELANEERYEDTEESTEILRTLKHHLKMGFGKKQFANVVEKLVDCTKEQMPIVDDEMAYILKWRKNVGKVYHFYTEWTNPKRKINAKTGNEICQKLYKKGWYACNSDGIENAITKIVQPQIDEMLAKPDWTPPIGVYDRSMPDYMNHEKVKSILQGWCEDKGITKAVGSYFGSQGAGVIKATLHVSKPTDKHLYQYYQDCKTTPITTNLHIDPKDGICKAILYLKTIEEDNGPIWFVDTSNRWERDPLMAIFARGLSTGCYCENPIARRSVFRLPSRIRHSFQFGRNLLDGSEQQKLILDKSTRITTSKHGNFVLFDPGNTMHTGGWPKEGYRANLQIQIKPW